MKKSLQLIALLMAALTVLAVFASCAEPENPSDVTTPSAVVDSTGGPDETKSIYDKDGYLLDKIPDDLKFNDEEINILCWKAERDEFEITEDKLDGTIVTEAIYNRNINTESRLGVKLVWDMIPGDNGNIDNFCKQVENQYAGGFIYDIIATYTRTAGTLCTKGYLQDLNDIENSYLDFSNPWWPARLTKTVDINGKMFFASGDISTNILHFMYGIYYNKELLNSMNLEDPVKFVDDKTWTIDKLIDMTKDAYSDLDGNGKISEGDRFGFGAIYYHLDAFYTGSGLRLLESDPEELIVISEDFTSDKTIALCDKLADWLVTENCYISSDSTTRSYQVPFVNGNELFCQNRVYMADQQNGCKLHDVTWEYGILPTPLYDENQEEYITVLGNPVTLWCIEKDQTPERQSMNSAVMECLASYGYRLTTPALFETNMKYRYTPDQKGDSMRMFDIIHDNIDFDLGRIFSKQNSYMSEIPTRIISDGGKYGAVATAKYKTVKTLIKNQLIKPLLENYDW
ncbi:MAG: extracellular solute-binding protein [Clostridia bacterium]|nr:extracellular solute-binding protein [Clostridia bacterium]